MTTALRRLAARTAAVDRAVWWLAAAALLVYGPAIWWGLPYATNAVTIRGWDVDAVTGVSTLAELSNLVAARQADWYVAYPMLHYIILAIVYAPVLAILKLTGGMGAPSGAYPFGLGNPVLVLEVLSLLGRLVTLAMAAGTVIATYLTGRRLWSREAGLAAALIALLSVPMVFYARTGNLDVPVLFWTAAGIAVLAAVVTNGYTVRRGIWLGVCAACAVGTKDQAYGFWVPVLALLGAVELFGPRRSAAGRRAVLATVIAGAAAYAVASGLVLSPARFAAHLRFITNFEQSFYNIVHRPDLLRPAGVAGWPALTADVVAGMASAVGPVVLLLAAAGAVLAWRRHRLAAALLLAGLLGFVVLVIFPVRHMQYRYALLPALIAALFAGQAWAVAYRGSPAWRRAAVASFAIALLWCSARALDLTWQMLKDARLAGGEWLAANSKPGDQVGYFGAAHQLPKIPPGVTPVRLPGGDSAAVALDTSSVTYVFVIPEYFADSARERSTFLPAATYRGLQDSSLGWRRVARFTTKPLLGPVDYLPYVNPMMQVFARAAVQ